MFDQGAGKACDSTLHLANAVGLTGPRTRPTLASAARTLAAGSTLRRRDACVYASRRRAGAIELHNGPSAYRRASVRIHETVSRSACRHAAIPRAVSTGCRDAQMCTLRWLGRSSSTSIHDGRARGKNRHFKRNSDTEPGPPIVRRCSAYVDARGCCRRRGAAAARNDASVATGTRVVTWCAHRRRATISVPPGVQG